MTDRIEFPDTVVPLRFEPSFEKIPDDEAETSKELAQTTPRDAEDDRARYGSCEPKRPRQGAWLLRGQLTVFDGLPPALTQGAFQRPAVFPAYLRFSTNPGDLLDHKVSTPRGLAVKIMGVEGPRLTRSEGALTQDFALSITPNALGAGHDHGPG